MTRTRIEHVNLTVSDNRRTADLLIALFGWHVRWEGASQNGGHTIHVGDEQYYLALYRQPDDCGCPKGFAKGVPLNHVGILVDDLMAVKAKVEAAGLEPLHHERYEPGERFYFFDRDGIEYEIVSYG